MSITPATLLRGAAVGVGATLVMDASAEALRRTRGVQPLDYALVGRWVGHLAQGRPRHANIMAAPPVPRERALGWATHYAIGTAFATALVVARPDWIERPTPAPALVTGVGTVLAPWLVMQPAFGMGVAGSRTPNPRLVRLRSLRTHAVYGAGLWLSGLTVRGVSGAPRRHAPRQPR